MAASAGNAMGVIGGFSKIKEGKRMQRAGQAGIDNFEWQDLSNPYKDLAISTAGSDLATENLATNTATAVNALRSGGTRGVVGGIGRVQANANQVNKEIAANLDEQQKTKDFAAAGQDVNNQNTIEGRQANELAGYGQMMNVGMDMKYQGYGDVQASGQAQSEHNMELFQTFGGAMGGGGGGGMSDRRLKKNIELLGKSKSGINIYSFEYIDTKYGEGVYQGVMADEVPNAVIEQPDGYLAVDYTKIDVEFKKIN